MKYLSSFLVMTLLASCGGGGGGPKVSTNTQSKENLLDGSLPPENTAPVTNTSPATNAPAPVTGTNPATGGSTSTTPAPAAAVGTLIAATANLSTGRVSSTSGTWSGDCKISALRDPKNVLSFCYLQVVITHQDLAPSACSYLNVDLKTVRIGAFQPVDRSLVAIFDASMPFNVPNNHAISKNTIYTFSDCGRSTTLNVPVNTYGTAGTDGLFFDKWQGKGPTLKLAIKNGVLSVEYVLNGNILQATLK